MLITFSVGWGSVDNCFMGTVLKGTLQHDFISSASKLQPLQLFLPVLPHNSGNLAGVFSATAQHAEAPGGLAQLARP